MPQSSALTRVQHAVLMAAYEISVKLLSPGLVPMPLLFFLVEQMFGDIERTERFLMLLSRKGFLTNAGESKGVFCVSLVRPQTPGPQEGEEPPFLTWYFLDYLVLNWRNGVRELNGESVHLLQYPGARAEETPEARRNLPRPWNENASLWDRLYGNSVPSHERRYMNTSRAKPVWLSKDSLHSPTTSTSGEETGTESPQVPNLLADLAQIAYLTEDGEIPLKAWEGLLRAYERNGKDAASLAQLAEREGWIVRNEMRISLSNKGRRVLLETEADAVLDIQTVLDILEGAGAAIRTTYG